MDFVFSYPDEMIAVISASILLAVSSL